MYKTIFAKQKAKINLHFHERTPWTSEQGRGLLLFEVNLLMTEDERKTNDLPLRLLEANDRGTLAVKCDVAMAEHILCGQYKGQPFFAFGGIIIKKNDAEKPAWCLCRTKNWRLVRLIEACGIRCFPSSEIIRITSDKGLICIYACAEDVKQPDTILKFPTTQCVPTIDYPAIIKGCYG